MSSSRPARHRADSSRKRVGSHGRIRIGVVLTAAAAGIALAAPPAMAAVNFDPSCPYTPSNGTGACGFVGKGDVQAALHYNNAQMQANAGKLTFTYAQPSSQALSRAEQQNGTQAGTQAGSQSASQSATQSATQEVDQTVSCDLPTGPTIQHRVGTRDAVRTGTRTATKTGTREGTREGSRAGTRNGSRAGTVSGNVGYTIAYDARVKNQINGFFLTSAAATGFVANADPVWGDYSWGSYGWGAYDFGAYDFGDYQWGDYDWGAYEWDDTITWGHWDAEASENPELCLHNPNATNVVDSGVVEGAVTDGGVAPDAVIEGAVVDGAITDGSVTDGAVTDGAISFGAVTPSGAAKLYVNGVALN